MTTLEYDAFYKKMKDALSVDDFEAAHIIEDKMKNEFIRALSRREYVSLQQVVDMAKELNNITNMPHDRWYA